MEQETMKKIMSAAIKAAEDIENARTGLPGNFGAVVRESLINTYAACPHVKDPEKFVSGLFESHGTRKLADTFLMVARSRFCVSMTAIQRMADTVWAKSPDNGSIEAGDMYALINDLCFVTGMGIVDGYRDSVEPTPPGCRRYDFRMPVAGAIDVSVPGKSYQDAVRNLEAARDPVHAFPGVFRKRLKYVGKGRIGIDQEDVVASFGLGYVSEMERLVADLGGYPSTMPPTLAAKGPAYGEGAAFRADFGPMAMPAEFMGMVGRRHPGKPTLSAYVLPATKDGGPTLEVRDDSGRICLLVVRDDHPFAYAAYVEFSGKMRPMLETLSAWRKSVSKNKVLTHGSYLDLVSAMGMAFTASCGVVGDFAGTGAEKDRVMSAMGKWLMPGDGVRMEVPERFRAGLGFVPMYRRLREGFELAADDGGWPVVCRFDQKGNMTSSGLLDHSGGYVRFADMDADERTCCERDGLVMVAELLAVAGRQMRPTVIDS